LCGFWALEWAWHFAETNLRCVNLNRLVHPDGQTDGQTDLTRSTRLVIL